MPQSILLMLLAVVFTAVLAVVQGLYWAYVARQEREAEELLRRLTGGSAEEIQESLIREQQNDAAAKALGGFGARIQHAIIAADSQLTVSGVATRMLGGAAVGAIVGFLLMRNPAGLILAVPAGYLPYMLLVNAGKARAQALVSQLPDALDLMARSLQAGVGLNDSFRMVAEEMPLPIAGEFGRVFEEVRFGRDYREAFHKMIDRNPGVFDLRLFVSSVLLQRETGGNLIEILENISNTIRARFGFQAKVRAMTSEAKFSAIVLGGLPGAVITLLTLTSPDYLTPLFEDPIGNFIVVIDIIMYGTGTMIMRDLTDVQV